MTTLTLDAELRARAVARLDLDPDPVHSEAASYPSPEEARRRRRDAARAFQHRLADECPGIICPPGNSPVVALSIGFHRELAALYSDVPKRTRRLFLGNYPSGAGYLGLLTRRPEGRDLSGRIVGRVTEAEAEHAAAQLATRARPDGSGQ